MLYLQNSEEDRTRSRKNTKIIKKTIILRNLTASLASAWGAVKGEMTEKPRVAAWVDLWVRMWENWREMRRVVAWAAQWGPKKGILKARE